MYYNDICRRTGVDDRMILSESTLYKLDVLDGVRSAITEGVGDDCVISMATSYSHSLFYEILENVKNALLQTIQRVLSALNNFYLNNVRLVEKYREPVKEGLRRLKEPIVHETYAYPDSTNYPLSLRSTSDGQTAVVRLHNRIRSGEMNERTVAAEVNASIRDFGKKVIGEAPDPFQIRASVTKIVETHIRGNGGRMIEVSVDGDTLEDYLTQISSYRAEKEDVQKTRKNLIEDYEALKDTYAKVTKDPEEFIHAGAMAIAEPEREAFLAHQRSRYADIHLEMMRLFNGYIAIYDTAFNVKLRELEQKISDRRNTITSVITASGMLATLNTKSSGDGRKVIPYQPKFIT